MTKDELQKRVVELESKNALLKKANQVARDQFVGRVVYTKLVLVLF